MKEAGRPQTQRSISRRGDWKKKKAGSRENRPRQVGKVAAVEAAPSGQSTPLDI